MFEIDPSEDKSVVPVKSFQEKMYDRIKDNLGDLVTDEELKQLIEKAMQKAFFEERTTKQGYSTSTSPPYVISVVEELMKPMVTEAVKKYINDNPDMVKQAIDETMAKGFFNLVKQHIEVTTSWPLQQLCEQLKQKGILF